MSNKYFPLRCAIYGLLLAMGVFARVWASSQQAAPYAVSYQSGQQGTTFNVDSAGNVNLSGSAASVNLNSGLTVSNSANTAAITTGGSIALSEPFAGTSYKKVILGIVNLTTSANTTFTYPVAFTQTPVEVNITMSAGTIGTFTNGTTGGTLATSGVAAATTGVIILEGR